MTLRYGKLVVATEELIKWLQCSRACFEGRPWALRKIPHPEEAAKQLSRRTHGADPADPRFPTRRKQGSSVVFAPRPMATRSGFGLRGGALRAAAALGQELVEFGLVLGVTQAVEKRFELALFFFEAAQGFRAVFIKGAVAARA